ncbi:MAG: nucleotidyl transferase AbiEii/AbiGii toxin family protein [bacterium]
MFDDRYLNQVRLLLRCLPEVARQECFAMKGGTAINLFVRDMPRISVHIDLAYLPLKPRADALAEISGALRSIRKDIQSRVEGCVVNEMVLGGHAMKLQVNGRDAVVIIEPNLIFRGAVYAPEKRELVPSAQRKCESYVSISTVALADLYGSKICAALDRQHPRDLFDVKLLLDDSGITADIRRAFVVYLAGHPRPMSELLDPRAQDIAGVFRDQFSGMTTDAITLEELIAVQHRLAKQVRAALDENEKAFLLSIKRGEPEWDRLGIPHLQELPALQWKVMNVQKMDGRKRAAALNKLACILGA